MTYDEFQLLNYHKVYNNIPDIIPEKRDVGGGQMTADEVDRIGDIPDRSRIGIRGLRQDTFERFINKFGSEITHLYLFKDKLIEDFSPLENCSNLVYIYVFHNQRVTKLWNMSKNPDLQAMELFDFTRLHLLDGIETAPNLQHLDVGDVIWKTSVFNIIDPVFKCASLRSFGFGGKKIENVDLCKFADMPNLERIDFAPILFETERIAELMAKAPHLTGWSLRPYIQFERSEYVNIPDVRIVGKRKPSFFSDKDAEKIKKYEAEFYALIERFKSKPEA